MNPMRPTIVTGGLAVFAFCLLAGCSDKGDSISATEQASEKAGIDPPGIAETRAIAE